MVLRVLVRYGSCALKIKPTVAPALLPKIVMEDVPELSAEQLTLVMLPRHAAKLLVLFKANCALKIKPTVAPALLSMMRKEDVPELRAELRTLVMLPGHAAKLMVENADNYTTNQTEPTTNVTHAQKDMHNS